MEISVLTLVRNRTAHLRNLVRGLRRGEALPGELVVAVMGGEDPAPHLPDATFPVRFLSVERAGTDLPLAAARNAAARAARHPGLVFLDVDCIPAAHLVAGYRAALEKEPDALLVGEVRYLPPHAAENDWTESALYAASQPHPARPAPPGDGSAPRPVDRYELFWSLSFALRSATFWRLGGFDEDAFLGYGAEDTDFAFAARAGGVPLLSVGGARAFHQHHATYDPPLQHFGALVRNAQRFYEKWGAWPMEGWLAAFAERGLIEWHAEADRLIVRRPPSAGEVAAARQEAAAPFQDGVFRSEA